MKKIALAGVPRNGDLKRSELKADRKIPAIVYGKKFPSTSISIDEGVFAKIFKESGFTHIIDLAIGTKKQSVLVHDVQRHPVSGDMTHIDFLAIATGEKLTIEIPLTLTGNAPALRDGLLVEQLMDEVEVKCLPENLVDSFEVDVTALTVEGDIIQLKDVKIDTAKYEILTDLEQPVVTVLAPSDEVIENTAPVAEVTETAAPAEEAAKDSE